MKMVPWWMVDEFPGRLVGCKRVPGKGACDRKLHSPQNRNCRNCHAPAARTEIIKVFGVSAPAGKTRKKRGKVYRTNVDTVGINVGKVCRLTAPFFPY